MDEPLRIGAIIAARHPVIVPGSLMDDGHCPLEVVCHQISDGLAVAAGWRSRRRGTDPIHLWEELSLQKPLEIEALVEHGLDLSGRDVQCEETHEAPRSIRKRSGRSFRRGLSVGGAVQ